MCGRPKEQQAVPPPTPQHHLKITKVNKVTINQTRYIWACLPAQRYMKNI
jgi:hypothetical protein